MGNNHKRYRISDQDYNNQFHIIDFLNKSDINISKRYKIKSPPLSTNNYEEIREALYINTNQKRIIRIIPKYFKSDEELIEITKENSIIKSLNHVTVIKNYEFTEDENYFYMVEEYFKGKPLIDYLKSAIFSEKSAKKIMKQILDFLIYFHNKESKIYCDLCLENIYWDGEKIKLKHFKNCLKFSKNSKRHEIKGNPYYMSPEMIKGRYNQKTDIWSFGVVLFILLKGETPFYGKDLESIYNHISNYDLILSDTFFHSGESKNLLQNLFIKDYKKRISLKRIKYHPFFHENEKE